MVRAGLESLHIQRAFDTLLRMCGNLISHPTEQFSKSLFVRKILLHRPCEAYENSNTDIEELFSHL